MNISEANMKEAHNILYDKDENIPVYPRDIAAALQARDDRAAKLVEALRFYAEPGFLKSLLSVPCERIDVEDCATGTITTGVPLGTTAKQALAEYERDPATPTEDRTAAVLKALFDMRDAYNNKDGENPHGFELEALAEANRLLEGYYYTQAKSEVKP